MIARLPVRILTLALLSTLSTAVSAAEAPAIAGTWTWEWKDAQGATHRHVLEIEGDGATLAGRERFDDLPAVKVEGLKVDGKTVNFSVTRGERRATYSGKLADADTINGNVNVAVENQTSEFAWTAKRKPAAKG